MVDSTKTDQKEFLKNKRVVKGTPLHRLATRYALYGTLSLGCIHVTITYIVAHADIDEFWYTAGPQQITERAGRSGFSTKYGQDERTLADWKDVWEGTPAHSVVEYLSDTFNSFKERCFPSTPVDSVKQPSETTKKRKYSTSPTPSILDIFQR